MALDFLTDCAEILALALVMAAIWVWAPVVHHYVMGV